MEDLLLTRIEDLEKSKAFRNEQRLQPDGYCGPSRRRIILAPLMNTAKERCDFDLAVQTRNNEKEGLSATTKMSNNDNNLTLWIKMRKELKSELSNLKLSSSWLASKPNRTDIENKVLKYMKNNKAGRLLKGGNIQDEIDAIHSKNKKANGKDTPDVLQPLPEGLGVIAKFLHDKHLRLVDLFAQLDKNKDWYLARDEFCFKMAAIGVPLTSIQLEEILMCLDNDNNDMLDYQELSQGIEAFRQDDRLLKSLNCRDSNSSIILKKDNDCNLFSKESHSGTCSSLSDLTNQSSCLTVTPGGNTVSPTKKIADDKSKEKSKIKRKTKVVNEYSSTLSGNIGLLKEDFLKKNISQTNKTICSLNNEGCDVSESKFKHVLLHPLDKRIENVENNLKIRQPGLLCYNKDTFLSEADRKFISNKYFPDEELEKSIENQKNVKRYTRNRKKVSSKSNAPSPFWPQSLLDKMRLCMDNDSSIKGSNCMFQFIK